MEISTPMKHLQNEELHSQSSVVTADTPMLKQYLEIKHDHQDAILFFRLGDFYEMFLDDAKTASKLLDLTLTGRGKDENRIPMCGVPYHAAEGYISKLVQKGLKVAICEQTEEASAGKGLTKREVVKIVTPGSIIGFKTLQADQNNYLVSVQPLENASWALAYADISTGEFKLGIFNSTESLKQQITQLEPKEIIKPFQEILPISGSFLETETHFLDTFSANENLCHHLKVQHLKGFGLTDLEPGFSCAWALLAYVQQTQKQALPHLNTLKPIEKGRFLSMDSTTLGNLELIHARDGQPQEATLFWVLNHTLTAMGARKLKQNIRQPLLDPLAINQRLDAVQDLVQATNTRSECRALLGRVYDLERLLGRIVSNHHNPKDVLALKESLESLTDLPVLLEPLSSDLLQNSAHFFKDTLQPDSPIRGLIDTLQKAIKDDAPSVLRDGGIIKDHFSEELDALMLSFKSIRDWIAQLEPQEKEATGIKSLKVGFNKVFGYFIEVPQSQSSSVPVHYIRKQTLANAERYITSELKEKETILLHGEEKQIELETQIYLELVALIKSHLPTLQLIAFHLAELDVFQSLATAAFKRGYVRPKFSEASELTLNLIQGRHPVIETLTHSPFIPNTVQMDKNENRFLLITGPNMAGKSTLMRLIAVAVVMAQMGSFVAAESFTLSPVDKLFTRIGALDNLYFGQSTFMVEMLETANITHNATPNSLIVLDEVGRGTSTYDGMSIACAVSEYLVEELQARTLFATHYHELTHLQDRYEAVKNVNMEVVEANDTLVFTYTMKYGPADRSYGVHVAQMAGLPASIVTRANTLLNGLESEGFSFFSSGEKFSHAQEKAGIQETSMLDPRIKPEDDTKSYPESNQLGLF